MDPEFEARAAVARSLPRDFGEGWMSKPARDMFRIALFAGFDRKELVTRLIKLRVSKVQERHVLGIMAAMDLEEALGLD